MKYYRTQSYVAYRAAWIIPLSWGIFQSFQYQQVIVAPLMGLGCVLIWTTHYGFGINAKEKKYIDYLWIPGLKNGKIEEFGNIEYLFIKKNKLTQGGYFSSLSYSFQKDKYDGFIKFDETNKVYLATRDDKKELMRG